MKEKRGLQTLKKQNVKNTEVRPPLSYMFQQGLLVTSEHRQDVNCSLSTCSNAGTGRNFVQYPILFIVLRSYHLRKYQLLTWIKTPHPKFTFNIGYTVFLGKLFMC